MEIDAAPKPCWTDEPRDVRGTAVLGTGRGGFEAMPATLPLEYGTQDGFNLVAQVRMTGFEPGNPTNILDPANPRTRIRAYFDDTNVPLNFYAKCPFRSGYVPSPGGGYELVEGVAVIFETCWRADNLIGRPIRIELELLDDAGAYATDVKTAIAGAPPTDYPMDQGSPGCVHP